MSVFSSVDNGSIALSLSPDKDIADIRPSRREDGNVLPIVSSCTSRLLMSECCFCTVSGSERRFDREVVGEDRSHTVASDGEAGTGTGTGTGAGYLMTAFVASSFTPADCNCRLMDATAL